MRPHILTFTALLLLSVHASAQNRNPPEALEGLRDIALTVKYDKADGLTEVMRPTVLQMLQDRARDALRHAEVPLLQSTNEAEIMGKPRLIFTVTLNKPGWTVPAILVECRMYERVRLRRDPTKEMELATWVSSGVGHPKVTEQMLFSVFDGQINWFIKDYIAANPSPIIADLRRPDSKTELQDNPNSLQGLNGVRLFVWSVSGLPTDPPRETLMKMVQSEAESKLKQAGIPVLRYTKETDGNPLLYVSIRTTPPRASNPSIRVDIRFWQDVSLVKNPKKEIRAVTWESAALDPSPVTDEAVLKLVKAQLAQFIKSYKEANPKLATIDQ